MNRHLRRLPDLARTVRSALPGWSDDRLEQDLAAPPLDTPEERFYYRTFGQCHLSVGLYNQDDSLVASDPMGHVFPKRLSRPEACRSGSGFVCAGDHLYFTFDGLDRWPDAPAAATFVAAHVTPEQLTSVAAGTSIPSSLTQSEFQLVGLMLEGLDLRAAAERIGASYDTKRKQIQKIMEKLGVTSQIALMRTLALDLTVWLLDELLVQSGHDAETLLAKKHYGKDITINRITVGDHIEVPIWDFGARGGRPLLYFHSMLAPMILSPDLSAKLKARNLRLLMMPRHFIGLESALPPELRQARAIASLAESLDYITSQPLICIGDSAGCGWAARFAANHSHKVSALVLAATPQSLPNAKEQSLFNEISARVRQDHFLIAGMTRLYNTIARAPGLSQRALAYMYRNSPADMATLNCAFGEGRLQEWLKLIANQALHTSMDEVMNLQRNWVRDLQAVEVPIHFLHGDEDPICPMPDVEALAAVTPNATLHRFEEAGHFLLGQRFEEVTDLLGEGHA